MAREVKQVFTDGDATKMHSAAQIANLGDGLALIPRTIRATVTTHVLTLPNEAKAQALLEVWALTGTSDGRKTIVAKETAPSAGEVAITPGGDIIFNATDAVTLAWALYVPVEGTIQTKTIPVLASGAAALTQDHEAIQLISASLVASAGITLAGAKTIVARADGAPSSTEARLEIDGLTVFFNATDAGTGGEATITYIATPGIGSIDDAFGDLLEDDYPD
jgi:hypothetical protein